MARTARTRPAGIILLLVVATLLAACRAAPAAPATDGEAVVEGVTDGDTIDVSIAGQHESVRLLGIDTPETHHPTKPVECYGAEASARTTELLPVGSKVRLVRDEEARDRYNRLLAYVYRLDDELFVNLALVTDGFADTLDIAPNGAHAAEFAGAVGVARAGSVGLWGACGGPDVPAR